MNDDPLLTSRPDEELRHALSTHWIKYVGPTIIFALFIVTGIGMLLIAMNALRNFPATAYLLFFAGMLLTHIAHHFLFHRLLSEATEDIIITSRRVIWLRKSLFRYDDMHQIPIEKILGVEARKHGILQTVLGYGCLWFDTGGTSANEKGAMIDQVPHPSRLARDINQLLHLK